MPEVNFKQLRQRMIETQIKARGISNRAVLNALEKVPRHLFVREYDPHLAYADCPLPISYCQTISQPYIVAYMSEAAQIAPEDKVLEIGTGSGYQTAVLAEMARAVYSVEIIPELAAQARQTLQELGYQNVYLKVGDGYRGWEEHAPYNAILVTAAPDRVPQPLLDQLALHGKMVIPIGSWYQQLMVFQKFPEGIRQQRAIAVRFVPLRRKSPSLSGIGN